MWSILLYYAWICRCFGRDYGSAATAYDTSNLDCQLSLYIHYILRHIIPQHNRKEKTFDYLLIASEGKWIQKRTLWLVQASHAAAVQAEGRFVDMTAVQWEAGAETNRPTGKSSPARGREKAALANRTQCLDDSLYSLCWRCVRITNVFRAKYAR